MAMVALALGLIAHFLLVFLAKTFPPQLLLSGAILTCWSFGQVIVVVYKMWLLFAIVIVAAGLIALGGAYRCDRRRAKSGNEDGAAEG